MPGVSADFPLLTDILITPLNGATYGAARSYIANTSFEPYRRDAFRHRTIPASRESIHLTDEPGEGTVNTEGLWRRGQRDWSHGAGQLFLDRETSDPSRFYQSKGIDPWTPNQLGLLPDTTQVYHNSLNGGGQVTVNLQTAVAQGYVYILESTGLLCTNPTSKVTRIGPNNWTQQTVCTGPTGTMCWIATDGDVVAVAGTSGVWKLTAGGTSFSHWIISGYGSNFMGYANGHWIYTNGPQVLDITGIALGEPAPNPIPGGPSNQNWQWFCICEGEGFLYMGGCYVDPSDLVITSSAIWGFSLDSTTYALSAPIVALPFANGEFVQGGGLYNYLNYVYVGTTHGIRQCSINNANDPTGQSGQLNAGPLIPNAIQPLQPPFYANQFLGVRGMIGYGRYVWFGWPNYDSQSQGLGRLDTGQLNGALQPAYASDLMVPFHGISGEQPWWLDWDPITNGPLICINDLAFGGVYVTKLSASTGLPLAVASGTMDSGRITWGIPDNKLVCQANYNQVNSGTILPGNVSGLTSGGTVALYSIADGAAPVLLSPLAPNTQQNPPVLVSPLTSGEEWRVQVVLSSGLGGTTWPYVSRYTVKALPQVVSGVKISAVISLYKSDEGGGQLAPPTDPYAEYAFLENLRLAQAPFTYTEAGSSQTQFTATCVIDEIDWLPFKKRDTPDGGFEGDAVIYLRSLVG